MMNIVISGASAKPIYQQLFDQVSSQIIRGELKPDDGLPPIRTVAKELRISVITVKKAWEELERQGFIYTVVGRGCFVADLSSGDITGIRDAMIDKKMAKDVAYYKELGLTLSDIIARVKKHYND